MVVSLKPLAAYSGIAIPAPVLIALLVCLIPTTIGGLLSAIGIAGMDRLTQHNVIAISGRAVEAAGDVHTLLLDKTGTITLGNRHAIASCPFPALVSRSWSTVLSWRPLPTKPPKDGASSSSRRSNSTYGSARRAAMGNRRSHSFPFPQRPG